MSYNNTDVPVMASAITTSEILMSTVMLIVSILSLFGNLLVIGAAVLREALRTPSNLFLVNLAFADLSQGIVAMPLRIMEVFNRSTEPLVPCLFVLFVTILFFGVSMFTVALISLDRFIAIRWPFVYRKISTRTNVYLAISITWFVITVFAALPVLPATEAAIKPPVKTKFCFFTHYFSEVYLVSLCAFINMLIILILVITNTYLLKQTLLHIRKIKSQVVPSISTSITHQTQDNNISTVYTIEIRTATTGGIGTTTNTNTNENASANTNTDTNTNTCADTTLNTNTTTNTTTDMIRKTSTDTIRNMSTDTTSNDKTNGITNTGTNINTKTITSMSTSTNAITNSNTSANTHTCSNTSTCSSTNTCTGTNAKTNTNTNTKTNTNANTNTSTNTDTNAKPNKITKIYPNTNTCENMNVSSILPTITTLTRMRYHREIKATKVTLAVVGFTIVLTTPIMVIDLVYLWCPTCPPAPVVTRISIAMAYANACVNPWIFAGFMRLYRQTYVEILKKTKDFVLCRHK